MAADFGGVDVVGAFFSQAANAKALARMRELARNVGECDFFIRTPCVMGDDSPDSLAEVSEVHQRDSRLNFLNTPENHAGFGVWSGLPTRKPTPPRSRRGSG